MDILLIMAVGMIVGRFAVPESFRPYNSRLQTLCTCLLIGTMGVSIGSAEGFIASLGAWGVQSLVFCLFSIVGSVAVVYLLTCLAMGEGRSVAPSASLQFVVPESHADAPGGAEEPSGERGAADAAVSRAPSHLRRTASQGAPEGGSRRSSTPRGAPRFAFDRFALAALVMLLIGAAIGVAAVGSTAVEVVARLSDPVLWALMFLVGIGVGMHRGLVASIREQHLKMLVIPIGVIAGSLAGGVLASLALGYPTNTGMAITSGLGWYSLAGVTLEHALGAQVGGVAFLANFLRELLSFFAIPLIARYLNAYACIASGGATSEDTTLPMIMRYTDERCVVYSVVNGIICSAAVPFLIAWCVG